MKKKNADLVWLNCNKMKRIDYVGQRREVKRRMTENRPEVEVKFGRSEVLKLSAKWVRT